jgi:hypothetical protein
LRQVASVAETLEVSPAQVYPCLGAEGPARQGQRDDELLEKPHAQLERALSTS